MRRLAPVLLALGLLPGSTHAQEAPAKPQAEGEPRAEDAPEWRSLFDGKTLAGWEETDFGGGGPVEVEDGAIVLPFGNNLTGITVTDEVAQTLPKTNYVLELDAKRISGSDFFCGLTLPVPSRPEGKTGKVEPSHATVILGGWGGGLVGLSSLDGLDASKNETTTYKRFETDRWYRLRVEVTDAGVRAAIDGEPLFTADISKRTVGMRSETTLSKPLGIATYVTTGAVKNIRVRPLTQKEVNAVNAATRGIETRGN